MRGQQAFRGHDGSTGHSFSPRLATPQQLRDHALWSLTGDIQGQGLGCLLRSSLWHSDQCFLLDGKFGGVLCRAAL